MKSLLTMSELNKCEKRSYQECLSGKYRMLRGWDVASVDKV